MMNPLPHFSGFSAGNLANISIPLEFFTDYLPAVDNLVELKVALHIFLFQGQISGSFPYIQKTDFYKDMRFIQSLDADPAKAGQLLDVAIESCVRRGILLVGKVKLDDKEAILYFLNNPRGRAAIQAIEKGEWKFGDKGLQNVELIPAPLNIYKLYEQHIGPITPLMADSLRDADEEFPGGWIEEAFRIAVEKNVRNWRYISAILQRWKEEGKIERESGQHPQETYRKYAEWENPELRRKKR